MKILVVVAWVCLILVACEPNNQTDVSAKQAEETKNQQHNQAYNSSEPPKSLRELKKGEFVSSKMLPVSELYPETNEDIYVHVKGLVVNSNEQETWAVVKDKDRYYFAFGHANEPMIKKRFLGKEVYIRALIDERLLKDRFVSHTQNKGLAPGNVPDTLVKEYQINVTKIALVEEVSAEKFMNLKK